jgi:hypothetical protein
MPDNVGIPIDLGAPTPPAKPLKTGHPALDRAFEHNARRAGGFDPEALKALEAERRKRLR